MNPQDDISTFDALRAWSEGSMPVEERARFEADLARDPARLKGAEEFRAVWNATAPGLGTTPASRTTFDDLLAHAEEREAPRASRWRRVAAAIVFVVAVPAAWLLWKHHAPSTPEVVKLRSIPLEVRDTSDVAERRVPALLANWSPVEGDTIRWLESMDDARAVSSVTGRPIFVYGYIEGCPICAGFQRNEFKDPEIIALIDKSVPVKINLMKLDKAAMDTIMARRYPLLEVQTEQGDIVRTFAGQMAEVDMRTELASVFKDVVSPSWVIVRELTLALLRARAAEAQGTLGEAVPAFETLARHRDLQPFAAAGDEGLSRLAASAGRTLQQARERARSDSEVALATLETDAARFKGTPFEADLQAVLDSWRTRGQFPVLEVQR